MGACERSDLLELLDDCIGTRLMPFFSQLPIMGWDTYRHAPSLVGAILDRVVPLSHKIEFKAVRNPGSHRAPLRKSRTAMSATRSARQSGAKSAGPMCCVTSTASARATALLG